MVGTAALRCRYQLPELFICCSVFGSVPNYQSSTMTSHFMILFFLKKNKFIYFLKEKKNKVNS
jgi:hypothetical protein